VLEENSQIYWVRIYASSGTSPGRGGPYGAVLFLSFLWKQESRAPGENRDPVFGMVPDFRRDNVWIPVFTLARRSATARRHGNDMPREWDIDNFLSM